MGCSGYTGRRYGLSDSPLKIRSPLSVCNGSRVCARAWVHKFMTVLRCKWQITTRSPGDLSALTARKFENHWLVCATRKQACDFKHNAPTRWTTSLSARVAQCATAWITSRFSAPAGPPSASIIARPTPRANDPLFTIHRRPAKQPTPPAKSATPTCSTPSAARPVVRSPAPPTATTTLALLMRPRPREHPRSSVRPRPSLQLPCAPRSTH